MAEVYPGVPPRHTFDRLGAAVRALKAQRVLELGTNIGFSTRELSKALAETGGKLWSVDINPPIDNWPKNWPHQNITFVQHDALTLDLSPLDAFGAQPLDILFIDDKHTYRHLFQELRRYQHLIKAGGKIFVDDPTHCDGILTQEMNCGLPVLWATALWCREVNLPFTCWTEDPCGLIEITVTTPLPKHTAPDLRIHHITGVATILNSTQYHRDDA